MLRNRRLRWKRQTIGLWPELSTKMGNAIQACGQCKLWAITQTQKQKTPILGCTLWCLHTVQEIPASLRVAAHITSTVSSCSRRGFFHLVSTAFFTSSKIYTPVFSPSVSPSFFTLFLDSFFGLLCFRFRLTGVSSIILFRARTLVVLRHGVLANWLVECFSLVVPNMVLSKLNIQKLVSQHTRRRYTFQPLWDSGLTK